MPYTTRTVQKIEIRAKLIDSNSITTEAHAFLSSKAFAGGTIICEERE